MYNYNRLGPWPLIDTEAVVWEPVVTIDRDERKEVWPHIQTTTVVDRISGMRVYVSDRDLQSRDQIAFAIPVNGVHENGMLMQYSFSGVCSVEGDNKVVITPFMARTDSPTLSTSLSTAVNQCSNPKMLPCDSRDNHSTGQEASWNVCAIAGDLTLESESPQVATNPLLFGFKVTNWHTGVNGVLIDCTMSVHRGSSSVDTFEAQR